ncbi:HalOD1 output domain-containing protein [Halopiger goleimassiliensis]|uniref:HalOD1 output domain-containing protein n=1 Tax=Halopiger goleimassiliensis TaxID=1293048 RepID=UPI000677BD68|nr:HalOD1 output domain-containing protein [Halopiger goleimassiliensis]
MSGTTLDYHRDSPSLRVVDAIATTTDTDPLELEPLYNVVDPEALDRLFRADADVTASVRFEYDGHTVEVRSDDTVVVDGVVHDGA